MNKKLVITLKSDLCVATGDGYSLGVDIDSCLDDAGFPYIPGRRIKGCLREAAAEIGCDALDALFGVPGASASGRIRVGNATLRGIQLLRDVAGQEKVGAAGVSALFTQVRAQTAIDNDSVKDGSLRFMRVVNHYSPLDQGELVFEATISFDDEYCEQVERAVKALRNMGYHRNRGFGAVRCALAAVDNAVQPIDCVKPFPGGFAYAIRLDDPLMIPQQGDMGLAYIPGTSVLGFFAGKLAKGLSAEEFEDLFLKDRVRFSPLYPVSGGQRSLPAFGLIAKIKGAVAGARDGQMVNLKAVGKLEDGEQPKPLKSGFVDAEQFYPVDVETEIVYHHSTGKATGDEATLYTQECLSAGQVFAGFVTGPDAALDKLLSVLEGGVLTFGRSKTAQYSRCSLVEYSGDLPTGDSLSELGVAVAVLDSDVLLDNGFGGYTNDSSVLLDKIADELGVSVENADEKFCSVKYRTISGYNAKWNQKKPHVRAFAAGSFFVFDGVQNAPKEFYVGERQAEGFGRVVMLPVAAVNPQKPEKEASAALPECEGAEKWRELLREGALRESLCSLALSCVEGATSLNASFVGRVLRMVEQAENPADLDARIASIKSEQKKATVQNVVRTARGLFGQVNWAWEQEALKMLFNCVKYRVKAKGGSDE